MKLMRSRFRLISLLLTCVFLLTVVVCAASALRQAGIPLPALPSVQQVLQPSVSPSPEASPSEEEASPAPPAAETVENLPQETDIQPDSEYNIYGL